MKSSRLLSASAVLLTLCAASGGARRDAAAEAPLSRSLVERGRYLTHDVAMCVQCHSPRDERGDILPGREFRGATNIFPAPFPPRPWASRSVNIRGLSGFPDEAVIRLLCDGIGRRGVPPDPPMPPFRMTRADAEAVIAYLRSLD